MTLRSWTFLSGFIFLMMSAVLRADAITDVVNNRARSDADRKADEYRKPESSLRFFGVKNGDVVLDFFAGAGYYSELMAAIVGPHGRVDVYNNQPYLDWVGAQLAERYNSDRMSNTRRVEVDVEALDLGEKQYDVIVAAMALHDIYYADPGNGWPLIDKTALYKKFYQALKPNGSLILIEHMADAGSGLRDVQTLHRIDEAYLLNDLAAFGFKVAQRSELLRNPKDDHKLSAFDPKIRYHTDRFMVRLTKTAAH